MFLFPWWWFVSEYISTMLYKQTCHITSTNIVWAKTLTGFTNPLTQYTVLQTRVNLKHYLDNRRQLTIYTTRTVYSVKAAWHTQYRWIYYWIDLPSIFFFWDMIIWCPTLYSFHCAWFCALLRILFDTLNLWLNTINKLPIKFLSNFSFFFIIIFGYGERSFYLR